MDAKEWRKHLIQQIIDLDTLSRSYTDNCNYLPISNLTVFAWAMLTGDLTETQKALRTWARYTISNMKNGAKILEELDKELE